MPIAGIRLPISLLSPFRDDLSVSIHVPHSPPSFLFPDFPERSPPPAVPERSCSDSKLSSWRRTLWCIISLLSSAPPRPCSNRRSEGFQGQERPPQPQPRRLLRCPHHVRAGRPLHRPTDGTTARTTPAATVHAFQRPQLLT